MTDDQYQHLLSIIEDNSSKLKDNSSQLDRIEGKLVEHDGHFRRIDGKLAEHDGHFRRIDEKLAEHDGRFDGQDAVLDLVLRKVGELNTRLGGFIDLMKASPLWRMIKVLES